MSPIFPTWIAKPWKLLKPNKAKIPVCFREIKCFMGFVDIFYQKIQLGSVKSELALLRNRQISCGCNGSLDTYGTVSLIILFWNFDVLGLIFFLNFFINKVLLIVCGLTWRVLWEDPCVIFSVTLGEFSVRLIDLSRTLPSTSANWYKSNVS